MSCPSLERGNGLSQSNCLDPGKRYVETPQPILDTLPGPPSAGASQLLWNAAARGRAIGSEVACQGLTGLLCETLILCRGRPKEAPVLI
jgi:hypothetical protein